MTKQQRNIVITMAIGIFLCMLDTTVMNIALPAMQKGLNVNLDQLSWALNIYTILFACLTIPLGRLADIIGRNRVYIVGLGLFLLGSILSGVAVNVTVLIIGRGVQSIGAAIVFPASMTIGISQANIAQRSRVIMMLGMTQGLASALGPTIGGAVTQYIGWRGIFLINVPFTLISLFLCLRLFKLNEKQNQRSRIDWVGMGLSMIMLFSLTLALTNGHKWGWTSFVVIALFVISVLTLVAFVAVERRVKQPMIPLALFQDKQFSGAVLTTVLAGIFLTAFLVLMPSFFTNVMGVDELQAALMITPTSVMIFVLSPISGNLVTKLGPRAVIATGFLLMAVGYCVLSFLSIDVYWHVLLATLFIGAGFGINVGPITVLAAGNFTGSLLTASQSVVGVFRQIGTSLAVAIFVSALSANLVTAKHETKVYADHQLTQLSVPASAKQNAHKDVAAKLDGRPVVKEPSMKEKQATLVKKLYPSVLQQAHATNAPVAVQQKILQQVRTKVAQQLQDIQKQMARFSHLVSKESHRLIVGAFTKPYQFALPVVLAALLVTPMFDKKNVYLEQQRKHLSVERTK